ncbi:hypothetical protein D3C81_957270 [compost metagenome]
MPHQDVQLRKTFCPRHGDELLAQRVGDIAAQQAHVDRGLHQCQREGRQDERADAAEWIVGEGHVARGRKPLQPDGEKQDQQEAKGEMRHRQHAESRAGNHAVGEAALAVAGPDAQRQRQQQRDGLRENHQLDRYRQPVGDRLRYRLPGQRRGAQIALHRVADPAEEAQVHRLVETEFVLQPGDLFGTCVVT